MGRIGTALATGMLVALASGVARGQDVTLKQRVVTRRPLAGGEMGRSVSLRTIRLRGRKARSDDDSDTAVILALDKKKLYTIDKLVKTYRVRNFEEDKDRGGIYQGLQIEQIEGEPRQSRKMMLIDQLEDGPAKWKLIRTQLTGDYRKRMLEKYNLRLKPAVIEVKKKASEVKFICSYKCTRYIATEDGEEMSSAWVTEGLRLEPELYEFLEKTGVIGRDLAAKLKTIKGLPLAYTVQARDGRITDTTTEAVDLRKIDSAFFKLPKGYREEKGR